MPKLYAVGDFFIVNNWWVREGLYTWVLGTILEASSVFSPRTALFAVSNSTKKDFQPITPLSKTMSWTLLHFIQGEEAIREVEALYLIALLKER